MDNIDERDTVLTPEEMAEEIEPQGFLDRVVNVYLDPHTLFKYLAVKPDFWTPWIIVGLLMLIVNVFTLPITFDLQREQQITQMEAQGKSPEDIAKDVETMDKIEPWQKGFAYVLTPVSPLLGWLIGAGVILLISLIQGLEASFKRLFSLMAYTSMISILGAGVIDKVIKLFQGADTLAAWQRSSISLAVLFPKELHAAILTPLNLIDPFFIWSMVVMTIGLTYMNKCRMRSAVVTTIVYFLVMVIFMIGIGFVQQHFTGGGSSGGGVRVEVNA